MKRLSAFLAMVWILFTVCGIARTVTAGCVCEGSCSCEDAEVLLQGDYEPIISDCSVAAVCQEICTRTNSGTVQDSEGSCTVTDTETTTIKTTSAPSTTTTTVASEATTSVADSLDFEIEITLPADDDRYARDECIRFEGVIVPTGGPTPGDGELAWTSSKDGAIGQGPSFLRCNLLPGSHRVTLAAEDFEGRQITDSVSIYITNERLEDDEEETCTAVTILGADHPDLVVLRRFRDEVLAKSPVGWELIKVYECNTPLFSHMLEQFPGLRATAKKMLEAVLPVLKRMEEVPKVN